MKSLKKLDMTECRIINQNGLGGLNLVELNAGHCGILGLELIELYASDN